MLKNIDKFIKKISLKNQQKALDKKFKEQGLTDEILEEQISINQKRYEYNLVDENELIYEDYVQ